MSEFISLLGDHKVGGKSLTAEQSAKRNSKRFLNCLGGYFRAMPAPEDFKYRQSNRHSQHHKS
jgi:hypothetical protein